MFSDGEHQFLHSLGLCLIYKNTNSLFLLDEPETHFNPDWRSKFISTLHDCFNKGENSVRREILITTHSPFLISDSKSEYVLEFEKDNGIVKVDRPKYNTLGASVDQISMMTFHKSETIGGYAKSKLDKFEQLFDAGEDGDTLINEMNKVLGDSVEKMFLIKAIQDNTKQG